MKQANLPSWKYRSQLRRVLRLLGRDEVVAASDLLDELMRDVEQFRAFTRSGAFPLFRKAVVAHERYLRSCIRSHEANINVLGFIRQDLRSKPWLAGATRTEKSKAPGVPPGDQHNRKSRMESRRRHHPTASVNRQQRIEKTRT